MPNDSVSHTLKVAVGVCLFCSLFVSMAAVALNAKQKENQRLDKIKNILVAGGLYDEKADLGKTYEEKVQASLIELATGDTIPPGQFNEVLKIEGFDIKAVAINPEYSRSLTLEEDLAGVGRIPKYMVIYYVKQQARIEKVILPVFGKGLWSTLYGFLALDGDLATVSGITFYEHGETPGLGGEVDNPRWQTIWHGKHAFDENGKVRIEVLKGQVDPNSANAEHQIDGLSGATITTRGVNNLVRFWLGENGYGPLLAILQKES